MADWRILETLAKSFPKKEDSTGIYEMLAREIHPVLRKCRDSVNALTSTYLATRCTVEELAATRGHYEGQVAHAVGYNATSPYGGGQFRWTTNLDLYTHDGGTVVGTTGYGFWVREFFHGSLDATWFGVYPQTTLAAATEDQSAAIELAYAASGLTGTPLYFPPGYIRVDNTVTFLPQVFEGAFGLGTRIHGSGMGATVFVSGVSDGPMFVCDSQVGSHLDARFAMGTDLSNFKIVQASGTTGGVGLKFRSTYMVKVQRIHVKGMSGTGIEVETTVGDPDASNMLFFEQTRVENCAGWGFDSPCADNINETSFITMDHCFFQGNGTTDGLAIPESGGMRWKGQVLSMRGCAFTINNNVALFLKGGAGASVNCDIAYTTFENNKQRGFYCTGITSFKARNIQIYASNPLYISHTAMEFDGTSHTVREVDVDGVLIRARGWNNPYTAFKLSGTTTTGGNAELDSCRVRGVNWGDFDHAGHTRFDGWQFDPIPMQCELAVLASTEIRLRPRLEFGQGGAMPLRLSGAGGGVPSTTGEWVPTIITTTGESLSNAGLAANTRYYCYLWDNAGARSIELSTTGTAQDADSGYLVKSGDARKLYVGSVETDAGALFKVAATGWMNPTRIAGSQLGLYKWQWTDANGDMRMTTGNSLPTSDTNGDIVGGRVITGSTTYDPGALADGAGVTTTVTVTGAALGNIAHASFGVDLQGVMLTAWVSAANTVSVRFQNETGGALTIASGIARTLLARVIKT